MNFGVAPNQLISKTVNWCFERGRRSYFLLTDSTDEYSDALADEAVVYLTSIGAQIFGHNSTTTEDSRELYITIVRAIADTGGCVVLNFLPTASTTILLR